MDDLTMGCSSSVVQNSEADEMRENIPPGVTTPAQRQYLDDKFFPDISLLDLTLNSDMHHTRDELSQLECMPQTPLTARKLVRKPGRIVEITNNSKLASFQMPRMEVKANGSKPCYLDTNASMFWLCDESLPDVTDYSFDSIMQQSINISVNISPSDMQLLNNRAQKAAIESNLEGVATLCLNDSTNKTSKPSPLTASQISFPKCKERDMSTSTDKHPTLGSGPTEQDGLPSGNTAECKTSMMSDNRTITQSTETSLHDGHYNALEAKSQSNNTLTMSESSCNGSHHSTFDAKPSCCSNGTINLPDSSCNDRHHDTFDAKLPSQSSGKVTTLGSSLSVLRNTFDANPPSQSNSVLSVSENVLNYSHHNTFDVKPPSMSNGGNTELESSTTDRHHNTFDANSSQSNGALSMSEHGPNDSHQNTFDAKPPCQFNEKSKTSENSSDRHHNTFESNLSQSKITSFMSEKGSDVSRHDTLDAKPPQSSSQMTLPNSTSNDGYSNPIDANPPSKNIGTMNMPESSSSNSHCNNFDANPPSQSNGALTMLESNSSHSHQNTFDAKLPKSNGAITLSESHSNDGHHNTLDAKPPQSSGKIAMSESQLSSSHQNTVDAEPKPNGAMTVAEKSSSDSPQNTSNVKHPTSNGTIRMSESHSSDARHSTFDDKAPSKPNGTKNLSGSCSNDSHPNGFESKPPSQPSSTDANAVEPPQGTCNANLSETASRASHCEARHHLRSLTYEQTSDPDNNGKAFNFDDTLDLRQEKFATSTPLTNCKLAPFYARPEGSKLQVSDLKLDGDTDSKPEVQPTPGVASNIGGPKIVPAKSLQPSSKPPSLLLKFKPSTLLPKLHDMPASGRHLPKLHLATRPLQESSAVSSAYNLRPTTTALRLNTATEKPQIANRPSGIPKGPSLLRPPSMRSNTMASSADKKPSNIAVNVPQTRKRILSRDAQLVVKKKAKTDVPTPSSNIAAPGPSVEASSAMRSLRPASQCQRAPAAKTTKDDAAVASAAAGDAISRAKNLKPPEKSSRTHLAKGSGCANCILLKAEIQQLKEELQRYKQEKDM